MQDAEGRGRVEGSAGMTLGLLNALLIAAGLALALSMASASPGRGDSLEAVQGIPAADIDEVTRRLNAEAPSCSAVADKVAGVLATPVGEEWGPDNPIEWDRAGWLVRSYGCGQASGTVRDRLIAALDFAEANTPIDNCTWERFNCWWIDQGINRLLGPAMLFGGDGLSGDVKPRMDTDYARFYGKTRRSENGADAIWAAFNNLYGALYFDDQERLEIVRDLANKSTTNEGYNGLIMQDWSYFYHWDKINNGYGASNARETARYLVLTRGTALELDPQAKAGFYPWFQHWIQWIKYLDYSDPLTQSKTPYWNEGYKLVTAAEYLLELDDPAFSEYGPTLQRIRQGLPEPFGAMMYPLDSFLVVRRPGFYTSVKLVSLADPPSEAASYNTMLGAANVLTPANVEEKLPGGWGSREALLIQHPYQVLGLLTTNAGMESQLYAIGDPNFVASMPPIRNWGWYGVSTLRGYYGLAAQSIDWELSGGRLDLEKAWFVFDDEILTTQTGSTTDPEGAQTWLLSFKINDPAVDSSGGVRTLPAAAGSQTDLGAPTWAQTNGFGYVFLKGESVRAIAVEDGYARLEADHGRSFTSAVALLPGHDASATAAYAANGIDILQLDQNAHIVRDRSSAVLAAAVFSSADLPEIALDRPGYAMLQPGDGFALSLFNPHLEEELGLQHPQLGEGFNPKYDVHVSNPTSNLYHLAIPYRLSKSTACQGCDLFQLTYDEAKRLTTLEIRLRVNRKFELRARSGDGYEIVEAAVGLNDPTAGLDAPQENPTFADVPTSHPYYRDIELLYRYGFSAGCSTSPLRFCPNEALTRAQSAVFVERGVHGANYVPPSPTEPVFADVPLAAWSAKWIHGLFHDGYTAGCGAQPLIYCPERQHTRAEGAVFYLRMLHDPSYLPPDPSGLFADVATTSWYARWTEEAYRAGLIPACAEGPPLRYCPDDLLTRALAAHMMVQAKGLQP